MEVQIGQRAEDLASDETDRGGSGGGGGQGQAEEGERVWEEVGGGREVAEGGREVGGGDGGGAFWSRCERGVVGEWQC